MEFLYLISGFLAGVIVCLLTYILALKPGNDALLKEMEKRMIDEKYRAGMVESQLEERKRDWEESLKQLKEAFDSLAFKALKSSNEVFLELAGKTFEDYLNQTKGDFARRQEAMEHLLKPFKESLDRHETLTKDIEKSTRETFGGLKSYLEELKGSQESLSKETRSLVSALKEPRIRGRWGEIGLKRLVEFSGLSGYCDFVEQVSLESEEGRLRPDMIVQLPGDKKVIIDSKVPLKAYIESMETEDEKERKEFLIKHARDVRDHMKRLADKKYWAQLDDTVDFVVLYMEVEPAFGAALLLDRELISDALDSRIILATPTTLITLLKTVAFSWKEHDIAENAMHIIKAGKDLFDRVCVFSKHLEKIGKNLEGAVKEYNSAVGSWESRVVPGARRLEELGASTEKREFKELSSVDTRTREMKRPGG